MKYCDQHNQHFEDYLDRCPICVGEEILESDDWTACRIILEPDVVAAIPLKKFKRQKPVEEVEFDDVASPSKEAMPSLFDQVFPDPPKRNHKPKFRRRK